MSIDIQNWRPIEGDLKSPLNPKTPSEPFRAGPSTAPNTVSFTGPSSAGNSATDLVMSLPDILRARSAMLVGSLELGAPLGRGSYGKVYKGVSPPPPRLAAFHRVPPSTGC